MSLAVKRYARALLEVAEEQDVLDETYSDFKALYDALTADDDFKKIFLSDMTTVSEKKELAGKILKDAGGVFSNFVYVLIDKKRYEEMPDIFLAFSEMYKDKKNILECEVVSASEMTDDQKKRMEATLAAKYQKDVRAVYRVDPSLIGGCQLFLRGKAYDGSIKTRLEELRSTLKSKSISNGE